MFDEYGRNWARNDAPGPLGDETAVAVARGGAGCGGGLAGPVALADAPQVGEAVGVDRRQRTVRVFRRFDRRRQFGRGRRRRSVGRHRRRRRRHLQLVRREDERRRRAALTHVVVLLPRGCTAHQTRKRG